MDGLCKTCKWWKADRWDAPVWGTCRLITDGWAVGKPDPKAEIEIDGQGVDGYRLATGPDFGCVQWEAKGAPDGP